MTHFLKNSKFLDERNAHRTAGLAVSFMWQDEHRERREINTTSIIGTLREPILEAPVYIIHVDGTEYSSFGYNYPVEEDIKVYLVESTVNGNKYEPATAIPTDEEIDEAEEHNIEIVCSQYAKLMKFIDSGAYDDRSPDGEWGEDGIEKRIWELDRAAIEHKLHYAPDKKDKDTYILESATKEELDAFQEALQAEEEAEE